MPGTDPRIAAFFEDAPRWKKELAAFRALLLAGGLEETFKWRGPTYTAHGGNVATIFGFKDACALSFFKGVLLTDPQGILEPPGENSRSARLVKVTDTVAIARLASTIEALVAEAIANEKAGLKVDFPKDDLPLPDELTDALAADPEFAAAFDALTPGRRRGWILHVSQPKKSETRASRIEKATPRILDGKGMHDR